jgi:hypothetical protein
VNYGLGDMMIMNLKHKKLVAMLAIAAQGLGGFATKADAADIVSSENLNNDKMESDSDAELEIRAKVPSEAGEATIPAFQKLSSRTRLASLIASGVFGVFIAATTSLLTIKLFGCNGGNRSDQGPTAPKYRSSPNWKRVLIHSGSGTPYDTLEAMISIKEEKEDNSLGDKVTSDIILVYGPPGDGKKKLYNALCARTKQSKSFVTDFKLSFEFVSFLSIDGLRTELRHALSGFELFDHKMHCFKNCAVGFCVVNTDESNADVLAYVQRFHKAMPEAAIVIIQTNLININDDIKKKNNDDIMVYGSIVKQLLTENFPRERLFYYTADLTNNTSKRLNLPEV